MCMKRRTILIILVLLSISACQNDNTVTTPESTAAVGSGDQIDPQETPTEITFDSLSPYRKGEELADKDPQFRLWAEPTVDDLVPPVSITCNGVDSRVYSPPYGLSVDNHCIVYSMNKATIALPDLSILMLDDSTELQVNIDGEGTEIIINQGGVYAVVAKQEEGKRFLVTMGRNGRFEALGTEFGVFINREDLVMEFYMTAGKVATYLCESLDSPICENWISSDMFVTPFAKYSRPIREMDWQETLTGEEWEYQDEYRNTFLGEAASLADVYARYNGTSDDPFDEGSSIGSYEQLWRALKGWIGNLNREEDNLYFGTTDEELWALVDEKNQRITSHYCEEYPSYCFAPTAEPTMVPAETGSDDPIWGSSGACSEVPASILSQVQSCDCGNKSSYGVYCYYSNGMEGWIPEACAREKNFCR